MHGQKSPQYIRRELTVFPNLCQTLYNNPVLGRVFTVMPEESEPGYIPTDRDVSIGISSSNRLC